MMRSTIFTPTAPLLKHRLLQLVDDPAQPSPPLLGKYLKIDERIAGYLLDSDELDARLCPYTAKVAPQTRLEVLLLPTEVKRRLNLLVRDKKSTADGLMLYFQGADGLGKQTTAEALCREIGLGMLVIDGDRLLHGEGPRFDVAVRLAGREAGLQTAALYWTGFDVLLADLGSKPAPLYLLSVRQVDPFDDIIVFVLGKWYFVSFLYLDTDR